MTPEVTEQVGAIGEAAIACANVGAAVLAVWWCIKCWRYIDEAAGVHRSYWVGCAECGAKLDGDQEGTVCGECGYDLAEEYDIDPDSGPGVDEPLANDCPECGAEIDEHLMAGGFGCKECGWGGDFDDAVPL